MDDRTDPPQPPSDPLIRALNRRGDRLSPGMRRVAAYLTAHPAAVRDQTALTIGAACGVSDATVVRTVRALGFAGLPDLRQILAKGQQPRANGAGRLRRSLHEMPSGRLQAMAALADSHSANLASLTAPDTLAALSAAVDLLAGPGRLVIFAQGSARPMGHFLGDLLQRYGFAPLVLDMRGADLADRMLGLSPADRAIMIAIGEPYPEALGFLAHLAALGIAPVLLGAHGGWAEDPRIALYLQAGPESEDRLTAKAPFFLILEMLLTGLLQGHGAQATASLEQLEDMRRLLAAPPRRRRRSGAAR